jgi:hypothetical protein
MKKGGLILATRKSANKQSKKVYVDFDWENKSPNKRTQKKINKEIKKMGFGTIMLAVLFLAIGAVGGFFGVKLMTKNDCFEIVGNDEITLQIGETYKDESVNVVSFGKNVSKDVEIETNLQKNENGEYFAEEEGTFYIIYKSTNFKYGTLFKVQKIRLITFVEATESEELPAGGQNE